MVVRPAFFQAMNRNRNVSVSRSRTRAKPQDKDLMRVPSTREIVELRSKVLSWFDKNGRQFPWRNRRSTLYQQILPEVLLQRTRADMVARFMPQFLKTYSSWKKLSEARETDLRKFLRPLGLWRRRAKSLISLART